MWWLGPGFQAGALVAAGTVVHHMIDSIISLAVFRLVLPVLRPGRYDPISPGRSC